MQNESRRSALSGDGSPLCLLLALLLCLTAGQVLAKPDLNVLAADPQWLALLHFGRSGEDYNRSSYVDDPAFFLAPDGARNPAAELAASLSALAEQPALRCRFIARFQWLRTRGLLAAASAQHCTEYWQWREQINAGQAALVFASSYLNSPSSMYGHTFLRLDPKGYRADSALLSYAVNYAALVPEHDGSLLFAWRGMSGGYPGHFSLQPYVEKLQEYSRLENRDVWEYELNLDDDQTLSFDAPEAADADVSDAQPQDDAVSIEPTVAPAAPVDETPTPSSADVMADEDDFDFLGQTDENATKLDLAKAYIDMGDNEGAKDILNEVISEGNDQQQSEARELLSQVG